MPNFPQALARHDPCYALSMWPPACRSVDVVVLSPEALVLPCGSCGKHAHITYVRTEFSEENTWVCPTCGQSNRLRLKGHVTDATLRAV